MPFAYAQHPVVGTRDILRYLRPMTYDELKLLDLAQQPETASPGEVRRLAEYVRRQLERPPEVTVPDGSVLLFAQDVSPYLGEAIQLAPEGAELLDLGGGVDPCQLLDDGKPFLEPGGELRMLGDSSPNAIFRIDDTRTVPLTLRPAGWSNEDEK